MVKIGTFLLLIGLLGACRSSTAEKLTGKWELDSAYFFYNGFGYTQPASAVESYEYFPDGTVMARYQDQEEKFLFAIEDQELKYLDAKGGLFSQYRIVDLDENNLVLKKEKRPLFDGNNQKRYEIRYFSKQNKIQR